ncbi:hypothetical protein FRZ67_12985 [Panacibacter ginsenosidivorans]|uniref:Uncharacterized protein n=1 Tax=Panacibacter ginsenosidivorans TaxID=1813871 RepID=A0A5B8VA73_9BACT|nr:hypothetical protein [Panacibacter ginsenosidivorans]QEC68169.1 hypothetical protein FRZ67_12985 [Panacibacter ginsenosidivorans]
MQEVSANKSISVFTVTAKIFSYIFHPLFIPTYVFFWLLIRFPYQFGGITPMALFARKITVFWMTAFFPAFSVFLLWRLKFIDNIMLRTQKERIAPYMITMIFYWWMWYLSRNFTDQPIVLRFFFLSIFFATILGLVLNSFFKISMHGMGVGGLLVFVLITNFYYQTFLGIDVAIVTLITGIVCTARLLLSEHDNFEVYSGLLIGALCQLIAFWVSA